MTDHDAVRGADVDAIRARESAATPGPWEVMVLTDPHHEDEYILTRKVGRDDVRIGESDEQADAVFIVNARTDIPALLDANDALTTEAERQAELTSTCSCETGPFGTGPEADCSVHGAIQAYNKAIAEVERLYADLADESDANTMLRDLLSGARAQITELEADSDESHHTRGLMEALLIGVANALKGDPGPLTRHDWSDLPAAAAKLVTELAQARATCCDCEHALEIHAEDGCHAWPAGVDCPCAVPYPVAETTREEPR